MKQHVSFTVCCEASAEAPSCQVVLDGGVLRGAFGDWDGDGGQDVLVAVAVVVVSHVGDRIVVDPVALTSPGASAADAWRVVAVAVVSEGLLLLLGHRLAVVSNKENLERACERL
jgi:hypothetical protein